MHGTKRLSAVPPKLRAKPFSRFPDNARTRSKGDAPVLNLPVRALFPRFQPRRRLSFTAFGRYLTPSTLCLLYRTNFCLSTAIYDRKVNSRAQAQFISPFVTFGDASSRNMVVVCRCASSTPCFGRTSPRSSSHSERSDRCPSSEEGRRWHVFAFPVGAMATRDLPPKRNCRR